MAILHKRKRKIIYEDKLYLWNIVKDDDYSEYYLNIISDDKKLYLSYKIDQTSDCFIHPKIKVLKSEKLEKGMYNLFPPIADEIISNQNVRAILNWHGNKEKTEKPIEFELQENPFKSIDFRSGIVTHIENDFSLESLREDMLQVHYPCDYLLDVGWYGTEQAFIIYIIKNQDWENPIAKTHKAFFNLHEAVKSAIVMIERQSNNNYT